VVHGGGPRRERAINGLFVIAGRVRVHRTGGEYVTDVMEACTVYTVYSHSHSCTSLLGSGRQEAAGSPTVERSIGG